MAFAELAAIIAWNKKNNGLLIVTWDEAEPDTGTNKIPTVVVGPMIRAGNEVSGEGRHYSTLRTIEARAGRRLSAEGLLVTSL